MHHSFISIIWKRAILFFLFNKGYIKLIKSDSKDYATKDFYFK